jgi:hypothetical protein
MVEVVLIEGAPERISSFATRLTQNPLDWREILKQEKEKPIEKCIQYIEKVAVDYEHLIAAEFGNRAIVFGDISRLSSLYLWRNIGAPNEVYGDGLERSFRIQAPPFTCIDAESTRLYELGLDAYVKGAERGIPNEDLRYVLPKAVQTTVVLNAPIGTERYIAKLANAFKKWPLEEHEELRNGLLKIIGKGYHFFSEEEPASEWKLWGREWTEEDMTVPSKNPFSSIINKTTDGSCSMYAQLVRQRMGLTEIEPAENIVRRARFELPHTFDREMETAYREIAAKAVETQTRYLNRKDPNFVYYLLLGQKGRGIFHTGGKNGESTAESRCCGAAQWEIRNKIGIPIAEFLEMGSKCYENKKCTETKKSRDKCPIKDDWPKLALEETRERLRVPLKDFEVKL